VWRVYDKSLHLTEASVTRRAGARPAPNSVAGETNVRRMERENDDLRLADYGSWSDGLR